MQETTVIYSKQVSKSQFTMTPNMFLGHRDHPQVVYSNCNFFALATPAFSSKRVCV